MSRPRPKCKICGKPCSSNGGGKWKTVCTLHHRARKLPYVSARGSVCERCGFIPENIGQLEVDHIDGNRKNNAITNLQTLCCNCHRLKTINNKDWNSGITVNIAIQGSLF